MCGIVGYVGKQQAAPILLDGLQRLEYRGYDSAGIAVSGPEGMRVKKAKGRLQVLKDLTHDGADLPGTLGIGHTRWATHGEPNDINAHPHVSRSGRIAVVHNGIIENFAELKGQLLHKGYQFKSETDTEVVVQLLDYYYEQCGDVLEAVRRMLSAVEGAYALGIVSADAPDMLIAARKDAPLLLGYGEGENFIASDVTAIIRHTRDISYMEDGEMAVLTAEKITVYDSRGHEVEKKHHRVDWNIDAAEKGGYAHFMLKEIFEQPRAIREATAARLQGGRVILKDLTMTPEEIRNIGRINHRLWLVLPCRYGGQVQPGADAPAQRGGGAGLRVPLQRPHCKAGGFGHRHQPIRRDPGHHGGPAGGQEAGRTDPVHCERGGLVHCPGV